MAKQFSMGSPEYVAQFYGGDKQRILQALQTGALATIAPPPYDQTVAIAAAAHIDRMNAAKAQAQGGANPPTVAEQVMGGASPTPPVPTPPAGGLGATPQAAPPMAPMQPPMPAPEGAPMGMADGGLVGIPVPETMFDEPTNGGFDDGYAGGGLVAFAGGGPLEAAFDAQFGTQPRQPEAPRFYGYSLDPRQNMQMVADLYGTPETKYSQALEQEMLGTLSPEGMKKARQSRKWEALADLGFRLASSKSPTFLGGLGEAGMGALPGIMEGKRLDKAERTYARKALADLESGRNTARAQQAAQALQMQQMAIQGYEAQTGRQFQASQNALGRDLDWRIAQLNNKTRLATSGGGGSDSDSGSDRGSEVTVNRYTEIREKYLGYKKDYQEAKRAWERAGKPGPNDRRGGDLLRAYVDAANLWRDYEKVYNSVKPKGGQRPAQVDSGRITPTKKSGGLPAGVTQAEWNAMTPEERALFQ